MGLGCGPGGLWRPRRGWLDTRLGVIGVLVPGDRGLAGIAVIGYVQKPSGRGRHTGPGIVLLEGPGGRRFLVTILTRLIAMCSHSRPQFSPVPDEMSQSSPVSIPYCFVRVILGSMLPIEIIYVQRAIL